MVHKTVINKLVVLLKVKPKMKCRSYWYWTHLGLLFRTESR